MATFLVVTAVVWIVCGVFAYGTTLYKFQTEYPTLRCPEDRYLAISMAVAGCIGLFVSLNNPGPRGLQFRLLDPISKEEYYGL